MFISTLHSPSRNSQGYDIAKKFSNKFTHLSPVWYELKSYAAGETDASGDKYPEQRVLLAESRRHEVVLLDNEIAFNEAIVEEREQGIQEIQQQIEEVNEICID